MTDNETKKALECCVSDNPPCSTCRYDGGTLTASECMGVLMKDALDLINRLEAENSNLTSALTSLQNDLTSAKAEVERLKISNFQFISDINGYKEKLKTAKSEAVKEFAERLKRQAYTTSQNILGKCWYEFDSELIDNLVKEMEKKYDNRSDN